MTAVLRTFLFAWQFLTAIPLSRSTHDAKPEELAVSMSWYPLVGCFLGAILITADLLLAQVFSTQVTSMLLMLLLIGITRGLHQDGLADMVDGLAGGRTAQARLAIMRDGHVGAIGATGLFLALGLRYAGLTALPAGEHSALLMGMPVVGRWAMVVGAFNVTYARPEGGLAQPFLAHLSWQHLCMATVTAGLVLTLLLGPWPALCCLLIGTVLIRLSTAWFHRMFGGVTGDLLGATNEMAEILYVLIVPVVLFR
ncbi:MAG TPA: adenosylcobinamide-GDP ribazoletransferase [Nitrospiraceae bacterium]|nr:adenosylcobinamide-GDP ribazoletransferase [Nitrospiraceae bacterium]